MLTALKWLMGLAVVAVVGVGAGLDFAFFGGVPPVAYTTPDLVPITLATATPSELPPAQLPANVLVPVPFATQAPLGNWAQRQQTCEEASLVMVDQYLRGDHSGVTIDPRTADAAINQITPWKPATDLTTEQIGQVAQANLGWAYQVLPADRLEMKQQLAMGRPLILGSVHRAWATPTIRAIAPTTSRPAGPSRTTWWWRGTTRRTPISSTTRESAGGTATTSPATG